MGWSNGRQLTSAVSDTHSITYTYDVSGYRSKKTVTTSDSTVTYNYLYQNGKVVRQLWNNGNSCIDFIYDSNGRPYAMVYNGTPYYYVLNQQGDVIRVVSADGTTYASYVYDAWGRLVGSSGSMQSINPIRYRGYYYDNDIKMYYLGSRFYDPALKRFVNADSYAGTGQGLLGYNMFAYCLNNPVAYVDTQGQLAAEATIAATNWWNPIGWIAGIVATIETAVVTYAFVALAYETYQSTSSVVHDANGVVSRNDGFTNASSAKPKSKSTSNAQVSPKTVSTAASPMPPNNNRDNKYRGGTLYNKAGVRVDFEYYGNGNGNVHIHTSSGKFHFSASRHTFVDAYGNIAPKAVRNLLKNPQIAKAVLRGLKYIAG